MYYSDDLVEEVRSKNNIVDVISEYVKLQKKGNSHFGLCPFHNEKTPSFSVGSNKQMYYCFGCGVGGNVFTFVMEYENFTFAEALKFLAARVGMDLPEVEYSDEAKARADLKTTLLEINKEAAKYFYAVLNSSDGEYAHKYLINRGLSKETISGFALGYANKYSDDLYKYLKNKGYSDEVLVQAGVIAIDEKRGGHDKFWNRVMFPIMDINNRVIGFGGRVMGDGMPKYLNTSETIIFDKSRNLYGFHKARTSRETYLLICEGYMDVIALHQAGFTNAVASLGTAFTMGQAKLIAQRGFKEVFLTYDTDEAGTKAAIRAVPILKDAGITAKIIRMEPYKDPDEYIEKMGAEAFKALIGKAKNGFMFGLEVLERQYDMTSPEGRTNFMKEAAKRLTEFDEEIERDNYIEAVAKVYNVRKDDLRKLVSKVAVQIGLAKPVARAISVEATNKPREDGNLKSQKILLTWLAEDKSIYLQIKDYIGADDFTKELYQEVAKILFDQYESGEVNPAQIMNFFTNEEEHKEVASLFHAKITHIDTKAAKERAIRDTLIRVKNNAVDYKLAHYDGTGPQGLQDLMKEKQAVNELNDLKINC